MHSLHCLLLFNLLADKMRNRFFFIAVIFFILRASVQAQSEPVELWEPLDRLEEETFLRSGRIPHVKVPKEKTLPFNSGNNVFIEQVGQNNEILTVVSSNDAVVNLKQNGTNNDIVLHVRANYIREDIEQIGNNNTFFDFVNNSAGKNHFGLQQHGNNIHVEKFGSNSISEKMNFKIEGDYKSLIIRNFK